MLDKVGRGVKTVDICIKCMCRSDVMRCRSDVMRSAHSFFTDQRYKI